MEISEQVDLVQRQVRAAKQIDARQQKTGATDMFSAVPRAERAGGRCEDVQALWLSYLALGERCAGTAHFADLVEATNWLPGELQSSPVWLVKAVAVRNQDSDATKRRTTPLHFEKSERFEPM